MRRPAPRSRSARSPRSRSPPTSTAFPPVAGGKAVEVGGERDLGLRADLERGAGRRMRRAWLGLVFPALLLNYFGQGALLLRDPAALENPFYRLVPNWGLYPLVALSSIATIIRPQAVISGAFS